MGYIMVGVRIDPDDWQLPVTADQIVSRTIERAADSNPETRGEVVLLHDSGGDRSATIESATAVDSRAKSKGPSLCPRVGSRRAYKRSSHAADSSEPARVFTRADAVAFFFCRRVAGRCNGVFLIGILLGLGRLLFVGSLAFAQWLRFATSRASARWC